MFDSTISFHRSPSMRLLMLLLFGLCINVASQQLDFSPSRAIQRLDTSLRVYKYDLEIQPFLPDYSIPAHKTAFTFDATVTLHIVADISSSELQLNAQDLNINMSSIELIKNGKIETIDGHKSQLTKQLFSIFTQFHKGEQGKLTMSYSGLIGRNMHGLYRSQYWDEHDQEKFMILTHNEATHARMVVPCQDEPNHKATWNVTIIHPVGTIALANSIEVSTTNTSDKNWQKTVFEETPLMSTYIFAIAVGDFRHHSELVKNGIRIRVYTDPTHVKDSGASLKVTGTLLDYYEKLFDLPYPLKKLDLIGINDFAAGAMENWGLMTFRTEYVTWNENSTAAVRSVNTIAHELSHQWLGNLVTTKWWNELWLNEGFATFMANQGLGLIYDDVEDAYLFSDQESAMSDDMLRSDQPMTHIIRKVKEIRQAFNSISYNKGAAVIHMIRKLMGKDNFLVAINKYIRRNAYGNVDSDDLFRYLDYHVPHSIEGPDGMKLNVTSFARQWTTTVGFPVVTATRKSSNTVELTQKRYILSSSYLFPSEYEQSDSHKWDIPVFYHDGTTEKFVWMTKEESSLFIQTDQPIIVNSNGDGYYFGSYDKKEWRNVVNRLKTNINAYPPIARHKLILAAELATCSGEIEAQTLMDLYHLNEKDNDIISKNSYSNLMTNVMRYYGNEPEALAVKLLFTEKDLVSYRRKRSTEEYKNYGKKLMKTIEKAHMEQNSSKKISNLVHKYGECDYECSLMKDSQFQEILTCPQGQKASECVKFHPSVRKHSYCHGVKKGSHEVFSKLKDLFTFETDLHERSNLLEGIFCVQDVQQLKKLLMEAIQSSDDNSTSIFKFREVVEAFRAASKNPNAQEFLSYFLISRWNIIYNGFHEVPQIIESIIRACVSPIRTVGRFQQMMHFFNNTVSANEIFVFRKSLEEAAHVVFWNQMYASSFLELAKEKFGVLAEIF